MTRNEGEISQIKTMNIQAIDGYIIFTYLLLVFCIAWHVKESQCTL